MFACMYLSALCGALCQGRPEKMWNPLELESCIVVSHGTESRSFATASSACNRRAISTLTPPPTPFEFDLFVCFVLF